MALQLDEEETEFFSAAMSFLDDFPDQQLHLQPLQPHTSRLHPHDHQQQQQLLHHQHHQLYQQQHQQQHVLHQAPRFEQLPDAVLPPNVAVHSDDDGSLASLDGVELQGLTEMCFPTTQSDQALATTRAQEPVDAGASAALTWEAALTTISKAYEPVNPTSPVVASSTGSSPANIKACGRPRSASRSRAKSKDKAPTERSKPKSHLPYNPNKARDERKLELIYLRKKVKEMEEQLETLQDTRDPKSVSEAVNGVRRKRLLGASTSSKPVLGVSTIAVPPSSGISDGTESSLPSVWKELCLRQLQRRVKAERENSRLKRELESQIKVAKGMEKLLNRPSSIKEEKNPQHKRARSVHVPPTDPMADAAIFDELIAGAEASYHDVDAVFKEVGLSDLETARRGAHVREGDKGMYLDIFANSVLPFDMRSTGEAVWEYFKGLRKHRGPLYQKTMKSLEPTEDTIIENFALELFANNTRADFRIRQVVKRFVEEDRVMVVWTAHVEPISVANEIFSGFGFREKAYVVCKRPPSTANSSSSGSFTLLQRCLRITPHAIVKQEHSNSSDLCSQTATRRLDSATVGTLTEFVLSLCAADMAADQELIENVLVDQAINQHTAPQR